ncbi:hypothetical protein [Paramagnetospirillum kuznetsovii]|nr:hypothetical protein [Paramagnetospirillum kuznetsovii]
MTVLVLVAAAVTGCASGEAFVDRSYTVRSVKKQKLPGYNGTLTVCYDGDAPTEKRDHLASEACEVYGLQAILIQEYKWQCRLTVPHLAVYSCVDPNMRLANGSYINPFMPGQVDRWVRGQKTEKADDGDQDQ